LLLKKLLKIKNLFYNNARIIREGNYLKIFSRLVLSSPFGKIVRINRNAGFLRSALLILFIFYTANASAPGTNSLIITEHSPYNPFLPLMYATGMVETEGNTKAYNIYENAVGIFQIRQVRVDDYNRRTGSNYKLADMFDYSVSEKVFLFFASDLGPYHFEKIAKAWNGSGPKTEAYWKRIRSYLE
jgi:hypothetical protein